MNKHIENIEIILKNPQLYYYSPILYRYYLVIDIINNYFEKEDNIAIWGGGLHTCEVFRVLSSNNKEKIKCIIDNNLREDIYGMGKKYILPSEIPEYKVKTIFISSQKYEEEIREDINKLSNEFIIFSMYKYLENMGIEFTSEFYSEVELSYFQIADCINKLHTSINSEEKIYLYKKLIGEYFHIKDFVNAFKTIDILIDLKEDGYHFYDKLKKDILKELEALKKVIRGKEHIVVNWMDALRPDEVCNMPYLNRLKKQGLYFENAHTVAPYTSATLKTIFKGNLYLDDCLYKIENLEELEDSKLYKILLENGYKFKYFGAKSRKGIFFNVNTFGFFLMNTVSYQISMCLWQWELLRELERNERCFAIVHMIAETHCPNLNGIQGNIKLIDEADIYRVYDKRCLENVEDIKIQVKTSQKYTDICFEFYHKLYSDIRYNIILSDHGQYRGEQPVCFQGHTKIFFLVLGIAVCKKEEKKLFSLINFPNLIHNLLGNSTSNYTSDYVLTQTDDCYSMKIFDRYHVNKEAYKEFYIQHRGVICLEDSYLQMISGEEYYFVEGEDGNQINNHKYSKRIEELKLLAGNKYIDIYQEEKYIYSRKLYEIFEVKVRDSVKFIE